jgi:hypothetical protein
MDKIEIIKNNIKESMARINEEKKYLSDNFLKLAKEFKIENLVLGTVDGHDHKTGACRKFNRMDSIFDLDGLVLDADDFRRGFPITIEFLKNFEPSNSLKYMEVEVYLKDIINDIEDEIEDFEYDYHFENLSEIVSIIVILIKNGISLERIKDIGDFLADVIDTPLDSLPEEWHWNVPEGWR